MQVFTRQPDRVRLALHLILNNITYLEVRVVLLYELWDLQLAQIRTHDKNIFDAFRVWKGLEHIEQMLKCSFSGYADERLWFAIGVRAHACSPARHGNDNSQRLFIHKTILPRDIRIKDKPDLIVKNESVIRVRRSYACPRMGCGL